MSNRLERDLKAEFTEATNQAAFHGTMVTLIKVIATEFTVRFMTLENIIDDSHQRMGNGNQGTAGPRRAAICRY